MIHNGFDWFFDKNYDKTEKAKGGRASLET